MDARQLGIAVAVIGAIGTAVAALADPLGIGEGEVFGWLQITGVIIGALVTLLGLALALEWVPYPRRGPADTTTTPNAAQNTTVVTDSTTTPRDTAP
jgi:hypothetical protein